MKNYTNHDEIRTLVGHFVSAFDDVKIKRFNPNGSVAKEIRPAFVYAPKQKVLHQITQRDNQLALPAIAVYVMNLNRNSKRQHGKNTTSIYKNGDSFHDTMQGVHQPNPVDLTIGMSMISRYQRDMDQMVTNFVPYTDPYIFLSMEHPITGEELQCKCVWSEDVQYEYPQDQESNSVFRVIANTSFRLEGWLFKAQNPKIGRVLKIDTTYTAVDSFPCLYGDLLDLQSVDSTDYFSILGRPYVRAANTTCVKAGSATTVTIYGQMFKEITGVYLSAGPGVTMPSASASTWTLWDTASADISQISAVSAFDAYALAEFAVSHEDPNRWENIEYMYWPKWTSDMSSGDYHKPLSIPWTKITVTIPPLSGSGFVDIIVVNPAGGGKLSADSRTVQINPYPTDHPSYSSWTPTLEPWVGVGLSVNST